MYEVYLESAAERDLKRLAAGIFHRIIQDIKALGENPRPSGCRKIKGAKSDWRIRMGSYRIIYGIDDKANKVKILRVRYRREAYRSYR